MRIPTVFTDIAEKSVRSVGISTVFTDLADFRRAQGVREIGEVGEVGKYSKSAVYTIRIL